MIQQIFKLIFQGIKALFKLLFPKKIVPTEGRDNHSGQPKIRIQFANFQLKDFDTASIWEFALDEEGEEGQDETTLRPLYGATIADPAEGLYIVKAQFTTANGKKYFGLCSPASEFDFGEIQPYMFTGDSTLAFWSGMLEPDKALIGNIYKQLNETKETLFPINFKALTPVKGVKLVGQINGFLWKPINDDKVITVK